MGKLSRWFLLSALGLLISCEMQRMDLYHDVERDAYSPELISAILGVSENNFLTQDIEGMILGETILFYIPEDIELASHSFRPDFTTENVRNLTVNGEAFTNGITPLPQRNYTLETLELEGIYGQELQYQVMLLHGFNLRIWGNDPINEVPINSLVSNQPSNYVYLDFTHEISGGNDVLAILQQHNGNMVFSDLIDWGLANGEAANRRFRITATFASPSTHDLTIPAGAFTDYMGGPLVQDSTMDMRYDPNLEGSLMVTLHHDNPTTWTGAPREHIFTNLPTNVLYVYSNTPLSNSQQLLDQLNSQNSGVSFTNLNDIGATAGQLFQVNYTLTVEGYLSLALGQGTIENNGYWNLDSSSTNVTLDTQRPSTPNLAYSGISGSNTLLLDLLPTVTDNSPVFYQLYYIQGISHEVTTPTTIVDFSAPEVQSISLTSIANGFDSGLDSNLDATIILTATDAAGNTRSSIPLLYRQKSVIYVSATHINRSNAVNHPGTIDEPYESIQAALDYALLTDATEVRVAAGTYTPHILGDVLNGSAIDVNDTSSANWIHLFIQLYSGISLLGGYNETFSMRDIENTPSIITSNNTTWRSFSLATMYYTDSAYWSSFYDTPNSPLPQSKRLSAIPDSSTILDGFTIQDGNDTLGGSGGAGLYTQHPITIRNCKFQDNLSYGSGGAIIYLNNGSETLTVLNCHFEGNNSDNHGGAIYSTGNIEILDSTFTSNIADDGGAITFAGDISHHMHIDNCNFNGNIGDDFGGAITLYDEADPVYPFGPLFIENSSFDGNKTNWHSGGAVYIRGGAPTYIYNCDFENNRANINGGAIEYESTDKLEIHYSDFVDNLAASDGGAISISQGDSDIFSCKFGIDNDSTSGNSAVNGGAIYFDGGGNLDIRRESSDPDPAGSRFDHNDATGNGGAIMITGDSTLFYEANWTTDNSAGSRGGVIYSLNSIVTILGQQFQNNSALNGGGFIYAVDNDLDVTTDKITISDNLFIYSNTAHNGGAIYGDSIQLILSDAVTFSNNEATNGSGGAVFLTNSEYYFDNNINFNNNSAAYNGGAVAIFNPPTTAVLPVYGILFSNFNGNRANGLSSTEGGGAIYVQDHSDFFPFIVHNSFFVDNYAENNGGAIYTMDSFTHVIQSIFLDNGDDPNSVLPPSNRGGAIYFDGTGASPIESTNIYLSLFANNWASNEGLAVFNARSTHSDTQSIYYNEIPTPGIYLVYNNDLDDNPMTINDCVYFHNGASEGMDDQFGPLTSTTFYNNTDEPLFTRMGDSKDANYYEQTNLSVVREEGENSVITTLEANFSQISGSAVDYNGDPRVLGIVDIGPFEQ